MARNAINRFKSAGKLLLLATSIPILGTPSVVHANEIQWRICNAAMGLGQAQARLELFSRAMARGMPADQLAFIQTNLKRLGRGGLFRSKGLLM